MELSQALSVLSKALEQDKEFFTQWKENISISVLENIDLFIPLSKSIQNGVEDFLNRLIEIENEKKG